jgi:hypothetical protein
VTRPPGWVAIADRALDAIARAVESARPTPTNFQGEHERVLAAWSRPTADLTPEFTYGSRRSLEPERAALRALRDAAPRGEQLAAAYVERIEELLLEADLGDVAVSSVDRARLASRRFGSPDGDALARAWLRISTEPSDEGELVRSDDARDPRSLHAAMLFELGRLRASIRVRSLDGLASLAAFKDGVVFVAKDRMVGARVVRRTVHHEVHGHAVPWLRGSRGAVGLLRFGSARGADDQEGFALVLEDRGGFLDGERRRELAARHEAARSAHEGIPFVEAMRALVGADVPVAVAVRAAMRAYRGSERGVGGLGRERVYLGGYVRVSGAFRDDPSLEAVLASGRVSIEAARALLGAPRPRARRLTDRR